MASFSSPAPTVLGSNNEVLGFVFALKLPPCKQQEEVLLALEFG
jgi:hypothetical protein